MLVRHPSIKVVAPSLTPDGYNAEWPEDELDDVVAPSLTPDGYNWSWVDPVKDVVVAPSLTPDGYNRGSYS